MIDLEIVERVSRDKCLYIYRCQIIQFWPSCIYFKRKINDKKVTRRFDDSMSSLSSAKKISVNW